MAYFNITLDVDKQSIVPQAVRARVGDAKGCKTRKNQETARVNAEKQRVTEFNTGEGGADADA